jgi:two-component system response regulator HydG
MLDSRIDEPASRLPADVPEERPTATLLVVDDDEGNRITLERMLSKEGYRVLQAGTGEAGLEIVRRERPAVVLTDLKMPGMDGIELLKATKGFAPATEVVLMTAYGTVESAVGAMKEGAYDFITKPFKRHQVLKTLKNAVDRHELTDENRRLKAKLAEVSKDQAAGIVGQSSAIRAVLDVVQQAAASTAAVLIVGESGTGKDLVASALHALSPRSSRPFVKVNCAAIPDTLIESELFGYEKGAFTGAVARKPGRFELADGGTIFLDEVGELAPTVQAKLLRVLQDGEIDRLGGTKSTKVDVRVIAATNADLPSMIAEKRFREDLFWRLNVIRIHVPALRERPEDIPLLAESFLRRHAAKNGKLVKGFTPEALAKLTKHGWPGNVRELDHAIERAVVLTRLDQIGPGDLPTESGMPAVTGSSTKTLNFPIGTPLAEIKKTAILETLKHVGGDKELAARLLKIAARTIYRQLESGEDGEG